jgi:hypothetical protein
MRKAMGIIVAAAAFHWGPVAAANMTPSDYRDGKSRIEAEYSADRQKCGHPRLGNATDVCVALARGTRKASLAELEAAYKPSARASYDAAIARADAEYGVAKQRCDYQAGDARKACAREAREARDNAKATAKLNRGTSPR